MNAASRSHLAELVTDLHRCVVRPPLSPFLLLSIIGAIRAPAQGVPVRDSLAITLVGPEQTSQVRLTYRRPLSRRGGDTLSRVGGELYASPGLMLGALRIPDGNYLLDFTAVPGSPATINITQLRNNITYQVGSVTPIVDTLPESIEFFTMHFTRVRVGPDEMGIEVNKSGSREVRHINGGIRAGLEILWGNQRWSIPIAAPDTLRKRPVGASDLSVRRARTIP